MWCSGMTTRPSPMLETRIQLDSISLRWVNGTTLGSPEVPLVSRMRTVSSSRLMLKSLQSPLGARVDSGRSSGASHLSVLRGRSAGRWC